MEKRTYYVSVGSGELVEDPTITPWEYEIKANDEEVKRLNELLNQANRQNMDVLYRVTHPISGGQEEHDMQNYDDTLQEIYKMIHRLGNEKAKEQIESSNMIEELGKDYM